MKTKIALVSDVSLGYGNPQLPLLVNWISQKFSHETETIIIEPDQTDKTPVKKIFEHIEIKRVWSPFQPYSSNGCIHFIEKSANLLNNLNPDILIISSAFSLPVLWKLKKKPKFTIYYLLESIDSYYNIQKNLNFHLEGKVDLLLFPEENRRIKFFEYVGYQPIETAVIYNCVNGKITSNQVPTETKNGKILYQGLIDRDLTLSRYFLNKNVQKIKIDIFGNFGGNQSQDLARSFDLFDAETRYCGFLSANELAKRRKHYNYGVVMWNPIDTNYLYACPNKFFEYIASGVPPIATPHPQCREIIEKYQCGILMEDWSFECFLDALKLAQEIYKTSQYNKMVENCVKAVNAELNWDYQMKKLDPVFEQQFKFHQSFN